MGKVYLYLSLFLFAVVAVFATINTEPARVNVFGITELNATVATLVLGSAAAGAALTALFGLARNVRGWRDTKKLKNSLKTAEEEIRLLRSKHTDTTAPKKDA